MDIDPPLVKPLHSGHPRGKPVYYYVLLIERDMKDVTVVVMSLPDRSPDRPADCPRLDFPVNEMPSVSRHFKIFKTDKNRSQLVSTGFYSLESGPP
jgi:hypothetical protein